MLWFQNLKYGWLVAEKCLVSMETFVKSIQIKKEKPTLYVRQLSSYT